MVFTSFDVDLFVRAVDPERSNRVLHRKSNIGEPFLSLQSPFVAFWGPGGTRRDIVLVETSQGHQTLRREA